MSPTAVPSPPTRTHGDISVTTCLSRFAAALRYEDLPAEVVDHVRRLLLDTLGCALGGSQTELGTIATRFAGLEQSAGVGCASIAAMPDLASARVAAEANGRLAGCMDADDTFPSAGQTSHHGASTVAAALAIAEQEGASGPELIAAVAAGYEVAARFGVSVPVHEQAPGTTQTSGFRVGGGPAGVLGPAVAAARLLGLDAGQTEHALGIVGAHVDAAPLKWFEGRVAPMVKSMDLGWSAAAGLSAASLAGLGMTGYENVLDGPFGLWRVLGYESFDFEGAKADVGTRWHLLDSAFKLFPCQYWMQSALRAFAEILRQQALEPEEIESVLLRANRRSSSPRFHDQHPEGSITCEFNYPHAVAMLALGVPPGPRWLDSAAQQEPRVQALREKVSVEIDPRTERIADLITDGTIRNMPASARVQARGETYEHSVDAGLGGPWSPETRLDDKALVTKLTSMVEPLAAKEPAWLGRAQPLVELLDRLPDLDDVRDLGALLRPPSA